MSGQTDYQEIEVKLYVPDLAVVAARLRDAAAEISKPRVYERNVRYENAAGTLTTQGIVVRLRADDRVRLTYKDGGRITTGGMIARFEAEVEVSDFDAMETILGKLGYHPHLIYEKYRTTYTLGAVEVVLDEMPFGSFVEIEGAEADIEAAITRLSLDAAPRFAAGYVRLFANVQRHLGLHFRDLTFANFEGIDVPVSAFEP